MTIGHGKSLHLNNFKNIFDEEKILLFKDGTTIFMINVFAQTDVGRVRSGNEDRFLVVDIISDAQDKLPDVQQYAVDDQNLVLMVSDGMGGAAAGEIASLLAVQTVKGVLNHGNTMDREDFSNQLESALQTANQIITQYAAKHPRTYGMGATATVAGILRNKVVIGQIGDSRAYLIHENVIEQLTRDQSYVNQLVEAGKITEEEAEVHPRRNIILQALGNQEFLDVALTNTTLQHGDFLLLCSDGLSGMLRKEEILEIVQSSANVKEACQGLVNLANERGGQDNITVILAQYQCAASSPEDKKKA